MPYDVDAEVMANTPLTTDYNVLALSASSVAQSVAPGQFVMLKAGRGHDPLLRRPFSIFELLRDTTGLQTGFSILNKRIGTSTGLLYEARRGQRVACLGPLGRPFTLVDPPCDAWMVAGGVGLAPFAELARVLRARNVTTTLFYGARSTSELFYLDYFRSLGVTVVVTTEDGSAGERGRIVTPLERAFGRRPSDAAVMTYACGPEGMLAATAKTARRFARPCEVSVERIMGCGMGGCYSCVIPMRGTRDGVHHVRSCLAGPVLPADQILWGL